MNNYNAPKHNNINFLFTNVTYIPPLHNNLNFRFPAVIVGVVTILVGL